MDGSKSKVPKYKLVNGFKIAEKFSTKAFLEALEYKPRDDDLFVCTFPKCGTTWTQTIIFLILNRGKSFDSVVEFMVRTPFLELTGPEAAENMPRPGVIKIHLPFHLTPYNPKTKYIYVSRNPKDTCVSFYHHTLGFGLYEFNGTFSDYFELFYTGENDFGEYFEHTLSWYEHRNDSNILFLTYEEMKQDIRKSVLKIARFLGEEWEKMLLDNPEIMEKVIKNSSVQEMKKNMQMSDVAGGKTDLKNLPQGLLYLNQKMVEAKSTNKDNFQFVRKGVVGDWKNYFSDEEAKMMDEKTREKLAGTKLLAFWQSLGILD